MPTTKARHTVTETDEIARALAAAARRWPQDSSRPGRLIAHLIEEGRLAIEPEVDAAIEERRAVIRRLAGSMTGVFSGQDAISLDQLRDEWPD
jgi:hypothetical protein